MLRLPCDCQYIRLDLRGQVPKHSQYLDHAPCSIVSYYFEDRESVRTAYWLAKAAYQLLLSLPSAVYLHPLCKLLIKSCLFARAKCVSSYPDITEWTATVVELRKLRPTCGCQ